MVLVYWKINHKTHQIVYNAIDVKDGLKMNHINIIRHVIQHKLLILIIQDIGMAIFGWCY